jgi:sensor histidine kinase YesM
LRTGLYNFKDNSIIQAQQYHCVTINYNFIFSNNPLNRLYRHVSFWLAFSLHFFIQNLIIGKANEALNPRTPLESLINISYFLPVYLLSTYIFIEVLIPVFLFKTRYTVFFIAAAALLLFNFISCYLAGVLYEHVEWKMPYEQITFATNKYHAIVNGGFVSVMILGIAGGIKVSKKWLQKQRENEALAQQKISSELQLLKIQINPRFLFHSLHTVKQHILCDSAHAPQLILQVSDLLSYILYESDHDYVLLEKELAIIKDYLALEENSLGENLRIETTISGDVAGKYIPPLILMTIVEISFEYFMEKQEEFSVKIFVEAQDDQLDFSIAYNIINYNSHELYDLNEKMTGIRKQLQNLYPGHHDFRVETTRGTTEVLLKQIPLMNAKPIKEDLKELNVIYENA